MNSPKMITVTILFFILLDCIGASIIGFFVIRALNASLQNANAEFEAALTDVLNAREDDVYHSLVAITPDNPYLTWHPNPGDDDPKRLLVATWTSYPGYQDKVGAACNLDPKVEVWVTPVPQLETFCRRTGLSGQVLGRRLEQYLGLPLGGGRTTVVELWVRQEDLFRPCPDPEISDQECRLGLPDIPEVEEVRATIGSERDAMEKKLDHARWFQQRFDQYYGPKAAPWSRLGYTYDWGNPTNQVGASEYIISKGATIWVGSVTPTDTYCDPGADPLPRSITNPPQDKGTC